MAFITYRVSLNPTLPGSDTLKGSFLTGAEIDANFKGLANDTSTLFSRQIISGAGLTGGGNLTANRTLSLADSGVSAGTYTKVTVDQYGRATAGQQLAAADVPIPVLSNDTTTNANTFFPVLSNNQTTGVMQTARVSSTKLFYNPSTGTLTSTVVVQSSDATLKENINTVPRALDVVKNLRGVSFNWKDTGTKSYGVIAQELKTVLPDLVVGEKDGDLTVNYSGIIAVLIEAIKELEAKVARLEE